MLYKTCILFFFLMSSCGIKTATKNTIEMKYIKSKGRSQNTPYYTIEIIGNTLNYEGLANISLLGKHTFIISKTELNTLKKALNTSNFNQLNETYIGDKRDLPLTYFTWDNHTITYQEAEIPKKLKELEAQINSLLFKNNVKPSKIR